METCTEVIFLWIIHPSTSTHTFFAENLCPGVLDEVVEKFMKEADYWLIVEWTMEGQALYRCRKKVSMMAELLFWKQQVASEESAIKIDVRSSHGCCKSADVRTRYRSMVQVLWLDGSTVRIVHGTCDQKSQTTVSYNQLKCLQNPAHPPNIFFS